MMDLLRLPIEILLIILGDLDLEEQFHLSLSNKSLQSAIRSCSAFKTLLERQAQFTPEYMEAHQSGRYDRAWRLLVKRKMALKTGSPFLLSVVAVADYFIYINGALVYTVGQNIRILLLQGSVTEELVIDSEKLVRECITRSRDREIFELKPLHYASGVATFLAQCSDNEERSFLIIWDTCKQSGFAHLVDAKGKLFIRNNSDYLYYGTKSDATAFRPGCWLIRCLDLQTKQGFPSPVQYPIGGRIGQTTSFEIMDEYLYGVSSLPVMNTELTSRNSFYIIFRLRLGTCSSTETLPQIQSWRRQPDEGLVDCRWSSIALAQDESTGSVFIYETRMEWFAHIGRWCRRCYRKQISFAPTNDPVTENLARNLGEFWNHEHFREDRPSDDIHSSDIPCSYEKSHLRLYNTSARAFMDVVSDMDGDSETRLCLQVCPMTTLPVQNDHLKAQVLVSEPCRLNTGVSVWPPRRFGKFGSTICQAHKVMCPRAAGRIRGWAADERNIIYSFGESGLPSPLVLISFDPGLRLRGVPKVVETPVQTGNFVDLHSLTNSPVSGEQVSEVRQPLYCSVLKHQHIPGIDLTLSTK